MALYDIEFIKEMTGITDTEIATFYTDAVIKKIERMIGYPLESTQQTDYVNGLGTSYVWLPRKPVTAISLVKVREQELVADEDYKARKLDTKPHLVLENSYLCDCEEAEVTNTAGYAELPPDILAFIISMIKQYESSIENGDLKSYKIDTISYSFSSWLEKSGAFINGIYDLFGVNI